VAAEERNIENDSLLRSQFLILIHQELIAEFSWIDFRIIDPYQVRQVGANTVEVSVQLGFKPKDRSIDLFSSSLKITESNQFPRKLREINESNLYSYATMFAAGIELQLGPHVLGKRFYEVLFEIVHKTFSAHSDSFGEFLKIDELVVKALQIWDESFGSKFGNIHLYSVSSSGEMLDVAVGLEDEDLVYSELNLVIPNDVSVENTVKSIIANMMVEASSRSSFAEDFGLKNLFDKKVSNPAKVKYDLSCESIFGAAHQGLLH
jgi:hypothetical protein